MTREFPDMLAVRPENLPPTTRFRAATPSVIKPVIAGICSPAATVEARPFVDQLTVKVWLPSAELVAV